jgi:hypothetical protein
LHADNRRAVRSQGVRPVRVQIQGTRGKPIENTETRVKIQGPVSITSVVPHGQGRSVRWEGLLVMRLLVLGAS